MRTGGDYHGGGSDWYGGIGPEERGTGPGRGPSGFGTGPRFEPPSGARARSRSPLDGLSSLLHPSRLSGSDRFSELIQAFSDAPGDRGGWQYAGGGRAVWTGPHQGDLPTERQLKALERAFAIPTALAMGSFGVIPGIAAFFGMRSDIRSLMRFMSQGDKNRTSGGMPFYGAPLPYYGMMNTPGIWDPAAMASNIDPSYMGPGGWMGAPYGYGMGGMGIPYPVPYPIPYPHPVPSAADTAARTQTSHAHSANNARFNVSSDGQIGHRSGRPWRLGDAGQSWQDIFGFDGKPTQAHIDLRYLALRTKLANAPGANAQAVAQDLARLDAFYREAIQHFGGRGTGTSGQSPFGL